MSRYLALILFLLLGACNSKETSKTVNNQDSSAEAAPDTLISGDFYKRYSGTVAGKPIVLHLQFVNGRLQGSYQYASQGKAIELRDYNDTTADDVHELMEIVPGQHTDGATWTLTVFGTAASGEWRDPATGSVAPIDLHVEYPQGSTRLQVFTVADSAALIADKPDGAKAISKYNYLQPTGSGMLNELLIRQIFPEHISGEEMQASIRQANQNYFDSYRNDNASLAESSETAGFSLNYDQEFSQQVVFNDQDWLVVELFTSSYTGGAHGNYASEYVNIDRSQNRNWSLMDMVTDTNALRPLLNEAAIVYFEIQPGTRISDRLFVEEVPVSTNVFLSSTGLCFVYNPYEITSYAEGQIKLFIPFSRLIPYLQPAFRERMRLAERTSPTQRA